MGGILNLLVFCSVTVFFAEISPIGMKFGMRHGIANIPDRSFEILGAILPEMAKLWPFFFF